MHDPVSEYASAAPITVLHGLGYDDDHSGIVSVVRAAAAAQLYSCVLGVNPGCVQHRTPPLPMLEMPAIALERIDLRTLWRARTVARAAAAWLAADRRRVFHGHSRTGLLTALWLHRWGERRVVASVHVFGRQRWFYRWSARQLGERLFWLGPAMKRYYGLPSADWSGCMPNGLARTPRTRERKAAGDRVIIGGAGMLVRWKGWHLVLEAMAALPRESAGRVEFRHIGAIDGTPDSAAYAQELAVLAARLGIADRVTWGGWQPSSAKLLEEADAVVVASEREPFSMIALEALFDGVPVIAADDGGPGDFVQEGASGWFFRSGDAHDLARVLTALLESDALRRVVIDPADLRRFEAGSVAQRWLEVYEGVIATAGR